MNIALPQFGKIYIIEASGNFEIDCAAQESVSRRLDQSGVASVWGRDHRYYEDANFLLCFTEDDVDKFDRLEDEVAGANTFLQFCKRMEDDEEKTKQVNHWSDLLEKAVSKRDAYVQAVIDDAVAVNRFNEIV